MKRDIHYSFQKYLMPLKYIRSVGVLNGSLGSFQTKEVNSIQVWLERGKDILIEEAWDEKS